MKAKEKYRLFAKDNAKINIFQQPFWLDAIVGNHQWDVAIIEQNEEIIAFWVFHIKKKFGFSIISIPPLCRYQAVWIKKYEQENETARLELIRKLWLQIPKNHNFTQFVAPEFSQKNLFNSLQLKVEILPTYIIPNLALQNDVENLWHHSKQRELKKAKKLFSIHENLDAETYYHVWSNHLTSKSKPLPSISLELLRKVFNTIVQYNCGTSIYTKNELGEIISIGFVLWDHQKLYYINNSTAKEASSKGSSTLLTFHALNLAKQKHLTFDFAGGSKESTAYYMQQFGAKLVNYEKISKSNFLFSIYLRCKSILK